MTDLLTVAAEKCKMPLLLLPNLNVPNSNLEMASYLIVLKGYQEAMLVLNTAHFAFQVLLVLQFGAL